MNTTTNYGLGKPLEDELYDIAVQNTNMDKIDTNLKSVSNTANSASSGLSTHTSNKNNPHTVTAAQIGLGNVPNVSTNNQTPSYTVPSSLSALVSGEILQTAFGKLAKAVNDLISHLANKSNPHAVTKSQVGLGNCDNTSDVNKPISTATQTALNGKADGINYSKVYSNPLECGIITSSSTTQQFADAMPNNSCFTFVATIENTVRITDVPGNYGVTTLIKGYNNNYICGFFHDTDGNLFHYKSHAAAAGNGWKKVTLT